MNPSDINLNQLAKEGYEIGGIEPDSKAFVKGLSGRKNLAPKYEYDPIAEREKKFSQLIEIDEQVKALLAVKDQLKDSFKAELESLEEELEGEGNPIIRSEISKAKISLRRVITYGFSREVNKIEKELKIQKDDLKDRKAREIRTGKARVKDQKVSVVFSS
jgi:hypothetical protein